MSAELQVQENEEALALKKEDEVCHRRGRVGRTEVTRNADWDSCVSTDPARNTENKQKYVSFCFSKPNNLI